MSTPAGVGAPIVRKRTFVSGSYIASVGGEECRCPLAMCVPNVAEGGLVTEAFAEVHLGNGEDKVNLDAANLVASAFDLAWVEWARRFPKGERNSVLQEETAREIFEAVPSIIARSGASSNVRARAQEAHSIVKKHLGWNQGAREGARP